MLKLIAAKNAMVCSSIILRKKHYEVWKVQSRSTLAMSLLAPRSTKFLMWPAQNARSKWNMYYSRTRLKYGFECCPSRKGIYFDAGEFRDYLEDEIYQQFQEVIDQL
jgi:hypothetical protein